MSRRCGTNERVTAGLPFHRLSDFMRMRAAQRREKIVGRENRRTVRDSRGEGSRLRAVFSFFLLSGAYCAPAI